MQRRQAPARALDGQAGAPSASSPARSWSAQACTLAARRPPPSRRPRPPPAWRACAQQGAHLKDTQGAVTEWLTSCEDAGKVLGGVSERFWNRLL